MAGQVVLVTGASGFIGANLTRRLITLDNDVHIITKKTSNLWRLHDLGRRFTKHELDLSESQKLTSLLRKTKPQYIFHLAARGAYSNQTDLTEMIQANIMGLTNLLTALEKIGYRAFINTGTSSEYGFKKKAMKEADLLEPNSFYAATKASGTLLSQVFATIPNQNIITIRPFSVYGPWEEPGRFIPTILLRQLQNQPLEITGGQVRHDFIYIDDLINAYLKAAGGKNLNGEIFNIGSAVQFTNLEVAKKVISTSGNKILVGKYEKRRWDTSHWVADNSKAKKMLQWQPKTDLNEGLKKTLLWLKQHKRYYEEA